MGGAFRNAIILLALYSVHDHKFQFLDPPVWAQEMPEDPCLRCHPERDEMQEAKSLAGSPEPAGEVH